MADDARNLFEKLKREGAQNVKRLISDDADEHALFDFKQPEPSGKPGMKSFAKATSAFANNRGGVLIWGVMKKGTDPAVDAPIKNLAAFVERLNDATTNLSTPVLDIESVALPTYDDEGYAVTYIPESKVKPVLSQVERVFYFRNGSNATPMDYRWIQSMFLATASPILKLDLVTLGHYSDTLHPHYWFVFRLKNVGIVPAKNICLICWSAFDRKTSFFDGHPDWFAKPQETRLSEFDSNLDPLDVRVLEPRGGVVNQRAGTVLYPGTELRAIRLTVQRGEMWLKRRVRMWIYADGHTSTKEFELSDADDRLRTTSDITAYNEWMR